MKINWFSFIGPFSWLFSLRVFLICRPCLFDNTHSPLLLHNSNILQCTCHCYAEWTTQKWAREHTVLTPRYVWDTYLCSVTKTISPGRGLLVKHSKTTIACLSLYLGTEFKLNLFAYLAGKASFLSGMIKSLMMHCVLYSHIFHIHSIMFLVYLDFQLYWLWPML